jgi:hypothetical protein
VGGNYSKNYCVSLGTSEQGDNRSQSQLVGREYCFVCGLCVQNKRKLAVYVELNLIWLVWGGGRGGEYLN